MDKELYCKICSNVYSDAVILPCNDCACASCLVSTLDIDVNQTNNRLINHYSKNGVNETVTRECPICNQTILLPPNGVLGLPRFKIIDPLLESIREKTKTKVLCDFCEDFERAEATLKCVECSFNYCRPCFDSVHVKRGPLAGHQIIHPYHIRDYGYDFCTTHHPERKKLFCIDCQLCVCFICKEIGAHEKHKTELATALFDQEKMKMSETSNDLEDQDKKLLEAIQRSEDFAIYVKTIGTETENHVISECDRLIGAIQRKKEKFLAQISSEYNRLQERISTVVNELNEDHRILGGLDEIITSAINSDDVIGVLESTALMNTKIKIARSTCHEHISNAKKNCKITPFSGLVLDVVQLRKEINALSWLRQPEPPMFEERDCCARNNQIFLSWQPQKGLADSYYLLMNGNLVYQGKQNKHVCVDVDYNATYSFRIFAENAAGKGKTGDELLISTPTGFTFEVDVNKTHEEIKVSRDLLSVRCNATEELQTVFADTILSRGVHYWKTRVENVSNKNSSKSCIAIGITQAKDDGDTIDNNGDKRDRASIEYAILIMLHSRTKKRVDANMVQIHRSPNEIVQQDITLRLDTNQKFFDVYVNGVLVKRDAYCDHTFEDITLCSFTPFVQFKHVTMQVRFINNLSMPNARPDKPCLDSSNCFAINTEIMFHWIDKSTAVDAYILEVFLDLETDKGRVVYQGNKSNFPYDAEEYNTTIFARLYAINIVGVSEFSDILCVKTAKGLNFSFDDVNYSALQLWSSNRSVKYSSPEPIVLFGDFKFEQGIHFWKLAIEQYDGRDTKLGIGIAAKNTSVDLFGVQDSYIINITSSKPSETPMFTIDVVKKKKVILQTEFAFLVDQGKRRLYCYANGMLITPTTDDVLNIPRSLWTFSSLKPNLYPAVKVEGNIKFSMLCNQPMIQRPSPPTFGKCYCDNITCNYTWFPSDESNSYTNYCILNVSVITGGNKNNSKKDEVFKEVFRGPSTTFCLKQLPYNSKITAFLTAMNTVGESDESERIVLFTAKGFFFEFDERFKSPSLVLSNQNQTVQLTSPVHSYVLGNKVMKKGFHSWKIVINEFSEQNQMSVVGIGISQSKLNDPILGEDQTSYAVQIIEHPKVNIRQTKHRHQLQMTSQKAVKTVVVVELNLDDNWMNIFVNGSQLRHNLQAVGQPTFDNVCGEYFPAVSLYGSRIRLSIGSIND
ncbi:E3 ubiquitin-protein ligase TRIM9-like [Hydractinia symbiolongicarpus]|uniref:E3 ubiquitin-protein ligase TRIM9-like n=1 Tax=Hydractinia symbiolongicarpus TaxID=13093 RepID=UPI00254D7C41|nr:E3 ubiquitin-protein ligase TRIM9-like [Hydractinia symbiolongicarpus]